MPRVVFRRPPTHLPPPPLTQALGMVVEWVAYTRKDFQFPHVQKFPHRDPTEESSFLRKLFPEGHAYVMGPLTADHWYMFVADYVSRPVTDCTDRTLDIMMAGIDEDVAKLFMKDDARFPKHSDVTSAAGIDTLLPGSTIQEFCFDPCGYSYWTIHITPEAHCSYASFETNIRMTSYSALVRAVLAIFRPKKFTLTVFADEYGLLAVTDAPFPAVIPVSLVDSPSRALCGPCVQLSGGEVVMPLAPPPLRGGEPSPSPPPSGFAGEPVGFMPDSPVPAPPVPHSSGRNPLSKAVVPSWGRATLGYVLTDKCSTDFIMGDYKSALGNYVCAHKTLGAGGPKGVPVGVLGAGAKERGVPRTEHSLSNKAEVLAAYARLRTSSI